MSISRASRLALAILGFAAASCTDAPSGADGRAAILAIEPVLAADGIAFQQTPPITRIRLIARQTPGDAVIETETVSVDADDEEWRLDFGIPVPSGEEIQVRVTIELISVQGGVETVQWSGVAGPFTLAPGPLGGPTQVPIVRGPLDNLGVTGVTITNESPTVDEGRTTTLTAQVSGGGPGSAVFWSSLDPEIATVNEQGVVAGVVPGTARIVATAGNHSDQVSVAVAVRVATIEVSPPTASLASIGATQTYTAKAFDPRGAEITGLTFQFSVSPTTVATHDGNGVMRATGNGQATVTAAARGSTGNATLNVQQVAASILISPPNPVIQNIGGTVQLTGVARDANNNPIAGAQVTWQSLTTNIATVNANSGLVTAVSSGVATIRATSGTLTATVSVSVGSQVFFTDGLETGNGWTLSGLANRTTGSGIVNTAHPDYVFTPGNTLPAAQQGAFYVWFGGPSQGNYMGQQIIEDDFDSGGTGVSPTGGAAASPAFVIPQGVPTIFVSFQSWFEIESVDPEGHDLMIIRVLDAGTGAALAVHVINSTIGSSGGVDHEGHSSGGFNAPPVFEPIELEVSNVAGRTLQIEFTFDTGDALYNGFRGWIIDNIRVASTPAGPAPSSLLMKLCGAAGCERPAAKRR